jgi:HK97 family phage prohead protease
MAKLAKPAERSTPRPAKVQIRMDGSTGAGFLGYASTTGDTYSVRDWLGEYSETIKPGAFRKTILESAVPLLHNHSADLVLAHTRSGTSRLAEDAIGLRNEADFDRRQTYVNDLCISLERGDVGAMSFAFAAVRETWNADYDRRSVDELKLFDTSIVTNPANPNTTAGLREAMRSALGREGRSLLFADTGLSVRSALPAARRGVLPHGDRALFERAFRAVSHADEELARRYDQGRARTALVAGSLLELRAGRVLSAANEELLNRALTALSDAGDHHQTAQNHISTVLGTAGGEGMDGNQGAGTDGSPIVPQDGAGPRSARSLRLQRQREQELRRMGIVRQLRKRPAELRAEREAELNQLRRRA